MPWAKLMWMTVASSLLGCASQTGRADVSSPKLSNARPPKTAHDLDKAKARIYGHKEATASRKNEWVYPCEENEAKRVLAELERLKEQLEAKAIEWPALKETLRTLSASNCFNIGGRLPSEHDDYQPGSWDAMALYFDMAWAHMEGFAALGAPSEMPVLWGTPTYPRTLTTEAAPDHNLASLLCSSVDELCLSETRSWKTRAEQRFQSVWARQQERKSAQMNSCREEAQELEDRFSAEIGCILSHTPKSVAFPVGGLRPPSSGWLRVGRDTSRQAHCYEELLVDLEDGRTLRKETCTKRVSTTGSHLYEWQPSAYSRGKVNERLSREAVWFALLVPELEAIVVTGVPFPAGRRARRKSHGESWLGAGTSRGLCYHPSSLNWSYSGRGHLFGVGSFVSEGCASEHVDGVDAELSNDYPLELFEVALASFTNIAAGTNAGAQAEFEQVLRDLPKAGYY